VISKPFAGSSWHGVAWTVLPVSARALVIHYSVPLVHTYPQFSSGHLPDMDVEGFNFPVTEAVAVSDNSETHIQFKCISDYGTTYA
jgi:hypothetical protein